MAANRIPDGFHTITPHLVCRDAKKAIEFYQRAFGDVPEEEMEERERVAMAQMKKTRQQISAGRFF